MEYIYSAMLLHSAGQKITEANVKKVLEAAGVKADDGKIKALTASLDGVNIEETIKNAASVPVAAAPAAAASGDAPAEGGDKKEDKKKKEEKEDEVSEEEAAAGLGALFG